MTCSDISALAPLYLSGELDSARAKTLSAHLESCPDCRREFEQQAAFDGNGRLYIFRQEVTA